MSYFLMYIMATINYKSRTNKYLNILRNNQRKLILKEQQEVAVEELLLGKDVLAVLPTGFGKSMIFTFFVLARQVMLKRLERMLLHVF